MTSGSPHSLEPKPAESLAGGIVVAANAADIARLKAAAPKLAAALFAEFDAEADLPPGLLDGATMAVIEIDPASAVSLARINAVRRAHPGLAVIAAMRDTGVLAVRKAMRLGAADIVTLPFDAADLQEQLLEVAASLVSDASGRRVAPLVAIVGSTGGCGATTIVTHLAAALAQGSPPRRVCVVDLDLQAGEVAHYVGQEPRVTVSALIDAGKGVDRDFLHSATTDSGHGFSVIAAPEAITALDEVEAERVLNVMDLVRSECEFVLTDLPADWTSWSLSVALAASRVVMVTELSVASLRQAKRRLQLLASVGLPASRVEIVANRVERRLFRSIGVKEAAEVLGQPIVAEIADAGEDMVAAQNEGRLITDIHRHSRFASDIEALAQTLIPEDR